MNLGRWMGGLAAGLALLLAGCGANGPSPLGDPAKGDSGLQCGPGKTLANGFYTLQNSSNQAVTVTGVRLIGGVGEKMTSRVYLIPVEQTGGGGTVILGENYWPVRWPTWKYRKRLPATIAPHATTNLVFAQTRTSDHPKSATIQVNYAAGGNSYTMTEATRVLVAVKCF
jgi:hypothetical protein